MTRSNTAAVALGGQCAKRVVLLTLAGAAVRADLVREYGHEILGAPAAEGVGLLAWLVPGVLGLTTLSGVAWKVLAAARAGSAAPFAPAPAGQAGALARLDEELRDLD